MQTAAPFPIPLSSLPVANNVFLFPCFFFLSSFLSGGTGEKPKLFCGVCCFSPPPRFLPSIGVGPHFRFDFFFLLLLSIPPDSLGKDRNSNCSSKFLLACRAFCVKIRLSCFFLTSPLKFRLLVLLLVFPPSSHRRRCHLFTPSSLCRNGVH